MEKAELVFATRLVIVSVSPAAISTVGAPCATPKSNAAAHAA